jgi:hypothetical protein
MEGFCFVISTSDLNRPNIGKDDVDKDTLFNYSDTLK